MAGMYGRKGIKRRSRKIVKKRTSGTSSRRKLQGMANKTRRAVGMAANIAPVAQAAYDLYKIYKGARKTGGSRLRKRTPDGDGGYNQWTQRYAQATFI